MSGQKDIWLEQIIEDIRNRVLPPVSGDPTDIIRAVIIVSKKAALRPLLEYCEERDCSGCAFYKEQGLPCHIKAELSFVDQDYFEKNVLARGDSK